jgi:hypothetical protein
MHVKSFTCTTSFPCNKGYDVSDELGDMEPGEISPPTWKPVLHFPTASPIIGPPVVTRDDYSYAYSLRKGPTSGASSSSATTSTADAQLASSESTWDRNTGIITNDREVVISLDMPLNHYCFPFDRQVFEFPIRMTTPEQMPFPRVSIESTLGMPQMSSTEEWRPYAGVLGMFSCFNNSIRVVTFYERMSYYYLVNIALVLFFITGMAAYPFWIDSEDLSARLQLNFTLVLTAVAFKYTVSTHLPRIPYLTYMDYFVLCNFGFIICCGIEHVISSRLDHKTSKALDLVFFCVAGFIWLFVHFVLVSLGTIGYLRPLWSDQALSDMRDASPKTLSTSSSTTSPSSSSSSSLKVTANPMKQDNISLMKNH